MSFFPGNFSLFISLPPFRHWLELGEKFYPRHQHVKELRAIVGGMNGRGSQGTSSEASPEQQPGSGVANLSSATHHNHEDSLLWSAGGGVASVLNGSRREAAGGATTGTPGRGNMSLLADR